MMLPRANLTESLRRLEFALRAVFATKASLNVPSSPVECSAFGVCSNMFAISDTDSLFGETDPWSLTTLSLIHI